MSILAIIVAAIGGFGVGAVWYMSLSEQWLAATGRTKEEIESDKNPLPFIIAGIGALTASAMMYHIFTSAGISGIFACLVAGLGIGLLIVAPWVVLHYAFAGRPKSLWWIDGGHSVVAFAVMGFLLGLFI